MQMIDIWVGLGYDPDNKNFVVMALSYESADDALKKAESRRFDPIKEFKVFHIGDNPVVMRDWVVAQGVPPDKVDRLIVKLNIQIAQKLAWVGKFGQN